jgi:hypothetical protein
MRIATGVADLIAGAQNQATHIRTVTPADLRRKAVAS